MLRTQYRCHPTISAISNNLFYDDQLLDGVTAEDRPPLAVSVPTVLYRYMKHQYCFCQLDLLQPTWPVLSFFNVSDASEVCERGNSFSNRAEASFVVLLLEALVCDDVSADSIGVITLYKAQQELISAMLAESK